MDPNQIDHGAIPELGFHFAGAANRVGARAIEASGREFVDLTSGDLDLAAAESVAERWRAAIVEAATEDMLDVQLLGQDAELRVVFAGQEGAPAELMGLVFDAAMGVHGVLVAGVLRVVSGLEAGDIEAVDHALRMTLRRMRALLVELNSHISGGWPYPFHTDIPALRERGVAFYRFPNRAATSLVAGDRSLNIHFEAGDLGKVTSSGCYVPTSLAGDFCVLVRYRLTAWQPGDDAASFALFVQDEPSLFRAYVQRSSSRSDGDAHAVFANFTGDLQPRRAVGEPAGTMRIRRVEGVLYLEHGDPGGQNFDLLGERSEVTRAPLFIGSKIWAGGPSGELAVELSGLEVTGTLASEQRPPVPVRPDPRG